MVLDWTPEFFEQNKVLCLDYLQDADNWHKVPSLNMEPLHNFKDHQIVRYTGMIQDMYDPEYYFSQYEMKNTKSGQSWMRSGKYYDMIDLGEDEILVEDSPRNVYSAHQKYYCISVPGVNSWVVEHLKSSKIATSPRSKQNTSNKRNLPEDENGTGPSTSQNVKQACVQANSSTANKPFHFDLHLPLPDPHAKACLLKVYEQGQKLSLNDVIEAVGFLSIHPALSYLGDDDDDDDDDDEASLERKAHNPPASLVPRLHVVKMKVLRHCNPLVDDSPNNIEDTFVKADTVRKDLRLLLTQLLLGDQLAADYLICHLLSTVYQRLNDEAYGQFSLNITNLQPNGYTRKLYSFLEKLVTKSHFFSMTLHNLNTATFTPKKDYAENRLKSGVLQLSAHTHLVLDETALETGDLNNTGVCNFAALTTLISKQKLGYDFEFHQLEFYANLPVLVFSEGKSLLPTNVRVPLEPDQSCLDTMDAIFEAAEYYLKEPLLNQIRAYLTTVRLAEYTLPEELREVIQEDFVKLRKKDSSTNATDLHRLIVLARLISLSKGERTLSRASWELANTMEKERKARISRQRIPRQRRYFH